MQNVADIFAAWPTDADLGRDIGMPYSTVSAWKQRGSIPAAYWRDIIHAACRRGHPEITADLLVHMHARQPESQQSPGFAEPEPPIFSSGTDLVSTQEPLAPRGSGHFTRWKHVRRSNFASVEAINEHIRALREEWDRR
jgi:hypothetical protein